MSPSPIACVAGIQAAQRHQCERPARVQLVDAQPDGSAGGARRVLPAPADPPAAPLVQLRQHEREPAHVELALEEDVVTSRIYVHTNR